MAHATAAAVWRWTGGGELPLVVDASSCTQGIAQEIGEALGDQARERHAKVEVIDSVTWALERLAPKLDVKRKVATAAIHPTCSGRHLATNTDLVALAWAARRGRHRPRRRRLLRVCGRPRLPASGADKRRHGAGGGRAGRA